MYVAFNLELSEAEWRRLLKENVKANIYKTVEEEMHFSEARVIESLDEYLINKKDLSAEKIEDDWFPPVSAEVFISHSHKDLDRACALAVYLRNRCGITSFIDSTVWGHANDLLGQIDNQYSKDDDDVYNYNKIQYSSGRIHMLLNGALMKMMDQTECIIFLNTPNTIAFRNLDDNEYTYSPWLYSELLMTRLLRKKEKIAHRLERADELYHKEKSEFTLCYNVRTNHLKELKLSDIEALGEKKYTNPSDALDQLYQAKGIIDNSSNIKVIAP